MGLYVNWLDEETFNLRIRVQVPAGPRTSARSYSGSIGDFESLGVGPTPARAIK